jgi:PiT family inorganic phosphate transporter
VLKVALLLSWEASPRINQLFKISQIPTVIVLVLSHGSNDSSKTMGMITLALMTGHYLSGLTMPPG